VIGRREALDLKYIHNASFARELHIHIVMEVVGRSAIAYQFALGKRIARRSSSLYLFRSSASSARTRHTRPTGNRCAPSTINYVLKSLHFFAEARGGDEGLYYLRFGSNAPHWKCVLLELDVSSSWPQNKH
jgi:hypothetical protein